MRVKSSVVLMLLFSLLGFQAELCHAFLDCPAPSSQFQSAPMSCCPSGHCGCAVQSQASQMFLGENSEIPSVTEKATISPAPAPVQNPLLRSAGHFAANVIHQLVLFKEKLYLLYSDYRI